MSAEPLPLALATDALVVFVAGRPAPQGSKRHVGHGVMVEMSKHLKPWREDIRCALLDTAGHPLRQFGGDPIVLRLEFVMPRPASTPKRSTPAAVKRPDLDKLCRSALDAIGSAGVWTDDSQVIDLHASKRLAELGETAGCHIRIEALA